MLQLYVSQCTYTARKVVSHDRSTVLRKRRKKLRGVPPEGTVGGSTLGSHAAVVAGHSLQRTFERHCTERAGAQVRVRGRLLPTTGVWGDRQAAVTALFLSKEHHRSS